MSRGKELIKNTGILMIAKISTQFISFLLLPLYTSLLSTEDYGTVDIYTSLIMIVVPFLTLQLEMGLFRFFITENAEDKRCKIISSSFCIIAIILSVATLIYFVAVLMHPFAYQFHVYLLYLATTLSTVMLQVCRAYGDNKDYGIASFISSSLGVLLNVIFIVGLGWRVEGILTASIIAQFVSFVYMVARTHVFRYFRFRDFSQEYSGKLLNYSVPLVFNQVSSWAINYSDRIIILNAWGSGTNGIYSVANKFSNITSTFFNIYNVAWTENVIRSIKDKDNEVYVSNVFHLTYGLYMALITGIINLLPFFYSIMVNENYNDSYYHVPILLLAMFFSGMAATLGSIYIAYGKTKDVSITTLLAGVCNVIVHMSLLHSCGLFAASISTLVAFGLLFVYRTIFIKKFYTVSLKAWKMLPQAMIYLIAWYAYSCKNYILIVFGFVLNLVFIGYLFCSYKEYLMRMLINKGD